MSSEKKILYLNTGYLLKINKRIAIKIGDYRSIGFFYFE